MKRIHKLHAGLVCTAIALLLLVGLANPASAAFVVKQAYDRIGATAGETLATGDIVCILAADGLAYKADANDATLRPAVGIVRKGAAAGHGVEIVTLGIVSGWTTLTPGSPAYLSETAGLVTQTAPVYAQQLGVALSATDIWVSPRNYINAAAITGLGSEVVAAESAGKAASLAVVTSFITTNGDADLDNVTLADGTSVGQLKIFSVKTEGAAGDTVKVTPAHLNGGTQITFDGTVGDGCIMVWDGAAWNIVANNGGVIA